MYFTEKNKFIKNPSVAEEENGEKIAVDKETEAEDEDRDMEEELCMQGEPT